MSTSSRGLSVWRRLPDYRDGEQVRRRPEVESNCLGCKHVLTPRSSLLALLPVSQSTWLRPSARVPTPDRANGTYASPLEDCSGSRLKLLVLRVPPSVWHRGSNLGLVSTSFGPMGWSGICVAGHHRASIPHSRRPFPWCGQPRSRLIEHWVVVESKFGMSWQSILPRAILDPSQAAYLFLSIHILPIVMLRHGLGCIVGGSGRSRRGFWKVALIIAGLLVPPAHLHLTSCRGYIVACRSAFMLHDNPLHPLPSGAIPSTSRPTSIDMC